MTASYGEPPLSRWPAETPGGLPFTRDIIARTMGLPLAGCVAVVTGASRGVGKGSALGLGEAGATVYVTGRTIRPGSGPIPGSLPETAEAVTALGGRGIVARCDHRNDLEVEALFKRVLSEQGHIDVLVNNVYPSPELKVGGVPFWDLPISYWDDLNSVGLRSHYVASVFAVPAMVARRSGLVVNISSSAAAEYSAMFGTAYGVAKSALDRLTSDMAHELRPHNVAVVSLWPGPVKGEKIAAQPERVPPEVLAFIRAKGETPQFTGRAITALAADPNVMNKSGQAFKVAELSREYEFSDLQQ